MSWNAEEFTATLRKTVTTFDRASAAQLCEGLIKHLLRTDDEYPVKEAERILQLLRNKRMFALLGKVGDAFIQSGRASVKMRRQYAQSLIDEGNLTAALAVLNDLTLLTREDPLENAEARGLIGRVHKQFYVNSKSPATASNREHLRRAITAYLDVYTAARTDHLWHGINAVALLKRAARDGVPTDGFPDAERLAGEILRTIEEKDCDARADMWDFATAVEACVALQTLEQGLQWLARYIAADYADAFELASTLRQLTEVWQLDTQSEPGLRLLPILQAELLKKEGGRVDLTRRELQAEQDPAVAVTYEKVFGADSYKSYKWYMTGAQRCLLVARIGRDSSQGYGSGFVLQGSDVSPKYGGDPVLLTNAHVVSNDPAVRKARGALPPEESVVIFEALGPEEYRIAELLWTSPPERLDATVLRLEGVNALKNKLEGKFAKIANALPVVDESARVYVIGYPRGGTLSLSLQDNLLLDHEDPRIHYRTPTEGGSSGSPVFNWQWDLVGLHHAGSQTMRMLNNKPGTYEANEGIWLRAIIKALSVT
jgi:Trypsin-like peptidase domain